MKLSRLRGRKTSDRVLKKGAVWRGKTMNVRWLSGHPASVLRTTAGRPKRPDVDTRKNAVYVGTFASGKLHKSAVKRNRMRRRCREALRLVIKEIDKLPTVQLLVSPRSSSLDCDFGDIRDDVHAFLSTLK